VRRALVRSVVVLSVLAVAATALAAARLPKPGTSSQVAALVEGASSIERLPSNLLPPLSQVPADNPGTYYGVAGHECEGMTKCVFSDKSSPRVVVLFGDSHAEMWLPALEPVVQAAHDRLVLIWRPGCPAAAVTVWDSATHKGDTACTSFRTKMVATIATARPVLVLLADRTADVPGPGNRPLSDATWEAGLESTITSLKKATTTVAVIGDVVALAPQLAECLAAYPTSVQKCSVPDPNPATHTHVAAERAAATAKGVAYLNPQPWLCTTVCSPVIGNMVAYWDNLHVSSTYAEYLSGVWAAALKGLLKT
jgi:hypothetical protein